jgi:hypothetical protein
MHRERYIVSGIALAGHLPDAAVIEARADRGRICAHGDSPWRMLRTCRCSRAGFAGRAAAFQPVGVEVAVTHTDGDISERRQMIGVLDDTGGPTWVATMTTYETGTHALIRVRDNEARLVLSVDRGGC